MKTTSDRKQDGFVAVIVAILLFAIVGFVALAVDVGVLYSARTSAQRVADAAALAGAFTFIVNPLAPQPDTAIDHAIQIALNDEILGVPVTAGDLNVNVDTTNRRVTVDVNTLQSTYFAKVMAPDSVTVGATGTAEASEFATGAACGIKPWFLPNTVFASGPACDACGAGEVLIQGGQLTGFGQSMLGEQFMLRSQTPSQSIAPGQFYAIQLPGSVGGADYRDNIVNACAVEMVQCMDWYSVETGNMVGPTVQGINDLIGNPPAETFLEVGQYQRADGTVSDTSNALVMAPIWDACGMAGFCPGNNFGTGTNVQLQIVGFALIFLEGIQGNEVRARLINVTSCAAAGGGGGGAQRRRGRRHIFAAITSGSRTAIKEKCCLRKIKVGLVTPYPDTAELLCTALAATNMTSVVVQSRDYLSNRTDWSMRQMKEADPEIIVVEIRDAAPALRCLQLLHSTLPTARLLVASVNTDPQLIIEAMRSGAREFLPMPVTQTSVLQALNRYVTERDQRGQQTRVKRGRLYSTLSAKRGSGATTLALNLAGIIAQGSGTRVGLLDLDQPIGDAAAYLNLKPTFGLSDAAAAAHRLDSVLLESYMTPAHNFHLLAGFREYTGTNAIPGDALGQLLDVSTQAFAHTFADLPEYLDQEKAQIITGASSAILVVLTPDVPSIWRTERLLNALSPLNVGNKIKIVLNRKSRSDVIADDEIEKLLQHPIDYRIPNDYLACMKAINMGRLIDPSEGKHLMRALRDLAAQISGLPGEEPRRSFLDLILKPSSIGGSNA